MFPVEKATVLDVQCLAAALQYTNWFTEIVCVDYALKDEGLAALSVMFASSPHVTKLVLVNIKATQKGIASLAQELQKGASTPEGISDMIF